MNKFSAARRAALIVVLGLFGLQVPARAAEAELVPVPLPPVSSSPAPSPTSPLPVIGVVLNGKPLSLDVPPVLINGRTFVPLRAIFEALGAEVEWNDGIITGRRGGQVIVLRIGSAQVTVNGVSQTLDAAPFITGGRTLVPARFVAENLGATVAWDPVTRTVRILVHSASFASPGGASSQRAASPEAAASPEQASSLEPAASLTLTVEPLPANGATTRYHAGEAVAPLRVITQAGSPNYLLKAVDVSTRQVVMTIFIRSGQSITTRVPLGTFEIRYAAGTTWYGDQHLFGPDTAFSKMDKPFAFSRTAASVSGYEIQLVYQAGGNLRTLPLRPEDF